MIYHSTRSLENGVNAREALLKGLCDDGGLYVSDELLTCVLTPDMLKGLTYRETALRVFSVLLSDFTKTELAEGIERAYADNFASVAVTPVTRVGDEFLLELHHGPTSAFKDVALCMLPQLMSAALGTGCRVMIATATSGDMGKAALSCITVFYPHGKVSDIQYLQMATQEGRNVAVAAVEGNFDDVQSTVKKIFASDLRQELADEGVELSSANSINIGRLVPQVVYYFDAYRQLVEANEVEQGAKVDFCVPTGNFGDVLAGYYAYRMGLPVRHFIVASNANNVLTDFLTTGVYDRNRPFVKTITPSMDILISSNLERMLYTHPRATRRSSPTSWRTSERGRLQGRGRDAERIRSLFKWPGRRRETPRRGLAQDGRLVDPHTAVASRSAQVPCVVLDEPSSSAATSTSRSLAGRLKAIPTASHTWTRFPGSRVKTPPRLLQGCARCPCSTRTSCVPRAWPTSSARPSRAHSDRGGRT
ncbi:MAG: threonine synthase [Sutterella wadsworthensis]